MQRWASLAAQAGSGLFEPALRPVSTEEALRDGPRHFFALAAEVARAQFDPAAQWDEFVQALWEQVDTGFGLSRDEDLAGAPQAWFEEPGDPDVVVWSERPESARG